MGFTEVDHFIYGVVLKEVFHDRSSKQCSRARGSNQNEKISGTYITYL
jgi:hypothetical protein